MSHILIIIFSIFFSFSAQAQLNIFACTAEWASLAQEISQDKAKIYTAVKPLQDAHDLKPKPSTVNKAAQADLLFCNGANLEGGWLPKILKSAKNPKIMPQAPGHFISADYVELKEFSEATPDEHGHNHPEGNPHFYLNPHNLLIVAEHFSKRIGEIDPIHAEFYKNNQENFAKKLTAKIKEWEAQSLDLKGTKIVTIHRNYNYLLAWLGLEEITTIEKLPGVNPSLKYLLETKALIDQQPTQILALVSPFDSKTYAKWLRENTDAKIINLPYSPTSNLFVLFDDIIEKLNSAKN